MTTLTLFDNLPGKVRRDAPATVGSWRRIVGGW